MQRRFQIAAGHIEIAGPGGCRCKDGSASQKKALHQC
jgi:hypothetical protein